MKILLPLLLLLAATAAHAERILLVPLDSRPAAGQFPQLIGKIDGVEVRMPTYEMLGRFTTQGNPDRILDWLEQQSMKDVTAMIVSTDMICYGGLIASRISEVSTEVANRRLARLINLKHRNPHVRLYLFSATMRLTPTATRRQSKVRMHLAQYERLKDMAERVGDPKARYLMREVARLVPAIEIRRYEATRARDHEIQLNLIRLMRDDTIDFLVIGQDDATAYGPHVSETVQLRQLVRDLELEHKVYFCEGVDQHSSVLLSRALLKQAEWSPRVRIVYSDDNGKSLFANYEATKIEDSLSEQLLASGARPALKDGEHDYTLYLNTPKRRESAFKDFLNKLETDLDSGEPVAVADINLGRDGTADSELFKGLIEHGRLTNLLSYAGWNTAGNTIGTSIPAANVYLLARKSKVDPLTREIAQREFLIHRFVNDYMYHKDTRPWVYSLIPEEHHEEIYGDEWDVINNDVAADLQKHLKNFFEETFMNRTFSVGDGLYRYTGLAGAKVWLPWPRPYEVRLEFHVQVAKATEATTASGNLLNHR